MKVPTSKRYQGGKRAGVGSGVKSRLERMTAHPRARVDGLHSLHRRDRVHANHSHAGAKGNRNVFATTDEGAGAAYLEYCRLISHICGVIVMRNGD